RPHEYLETYGSPQYESLCEKVDCSTAVQTETCAATELFGDGSPKLETLRVFRDAVLAKSATGRTIIDFYYNNGETITAVLKKNPVIKGTAKKTLESLLPMIEMIVKK
ncbi:MAG: hypothetical protein JRF40_15635, partial [Deltaproteobacteria bacterium]|nr:hypothetical protein [Deltaproteobacteria bacterium]